MNAWDFVQFYVRQLVQNYKLSTQTTIKLFYRWTWNICIINKTNKQNSLDFEQTLLLYAVYRCCTWCQLWTGIGQLTTKTTTLYRLTKMHMIEKRIIYMHYCQKSTARISMSRSTLCLAPNCVKDQRSTTKINNNPILAAYYTDLFFYL